MATPPLPLRDVHLPPELLATWWPLPLGWKVIIVLILISALFTYLFWRWHQYKTPMQQAQILLQQIRKNTNASNSDKLQIVATLCRQIALASGATEVAALTGRQWMQYLHNTIDPRFLGPNPRPPFVENEHLLTIMPYQKTPPDDQQTEIAISILEQWCVAARQQWFWRLAYTIRTTPRRIWLSLRTLLRL